MKNPVIIKSFPNGLSIYLDGEMPFAQLLEEVAVKFRESANFLRMPPWWFLSRGGS